LELEVLWNNKKAPNIGTNILLFQNKGPKFMEKEGAKVLCDRAHVQPKFVLLT
jgi:hypothetical protein